MFKLAPAVGDGDCRWNTTMLNLVRNCNGVFFLHLVEVVLEALSALSVHPGGHMFHAMSFLKGNKKKTLYRKML